MTCKALLLCTGLSSLSGHDFGFLKDERWPVATTSQCSQNAVCYAGEVDSHSKCLDYFMSWNMEDKLNLGIQTLYRYCFGGPPLWAMEAHDEPDKCGACGGPRVYEMQLMPPLLYFLQQASKDLPPSAYGPSEWSWFTLLVYSCAQVLVCFLLTSWFFCFQNI